MTSLHVYMLGWAVVVSAIIWIGYGPQQGTGGGWHAFMTVPGQFIDAVVLAWLAYTIPCVIAVLAWRRLERLSSRI